MATKSYLNPSSMEVLAALELTRKELRKKRIIHVGLCIAGAGIAVFGFLSGISLIGIAGVLCFITGFVLIALGSKAIDEYRLDFKRKLIAEALKMIDESLEIDPESGLNENEFIRSLLYNRRPDSYKSEDLVFGNSGKTKFSFSEVHAKYKQVRNTKNGRQESWHDIFRGVIFQADFNKNFKGATLVKSRVFGDSVTEWFTTNIPVFSSSETLVKLENTEFDKHFITHSSDQIEARYILTPLMMESILELNERCRYTISLSFIRNQVNIAFPLTKNYFEAPLFNSLLDDEVMQEDMALVRHVYRVIETLDLNTRIWGRA
ncbi:DUF3137 domain-containing protein [Pedobacter gandavensis]|uniref:DUF3137 domain-containing protein n=1 Tax=Pedobacter gandavensis TaxID=2679963 RepID=UPI00292FBA3B|nr:DUF3137 domain-containing protein [Pedobacter gandavensis]